MGRLLVTVDKNDRVTGAATFEACHDPQNLLLHRGCAVFVFRDSSLKETLLLRRNGRVRYPHTICGVGGHVETGETYLSAAQKELKEEAFHTLPFPKLELKAVGNVQVNTPVHSEFTAIFTTVHPGPFRTDPAEMEKILGFYHMDWIERDMQENPEKYAEDVITQFRFLRASPLHRVALLKKVSTEQNHGK